MTAARQLAPAPASVVERAFEGDSVRIVIRDGEPWFVAADVCAAIGIAEARSSVRALDDDERGVHTVHTPGGPQSTTVVSEPGLYSLVIRSRVPKAAAFRRWVTHEVLPSIRKTGGYGQDTLAALSDPATLRQLLGSYAERVEQLSAANAQLAPKAEVYDRIVDSGDTVGFREACKLIHAGTGAKEGEVRSLMVRRGWIQRLGGRLAAAHYGQDKGYTTTRDREVQTSSGEQLVVPELRITQRGVARAIEIFVASESDRKAAGQ